MYYLEHDSPGNVLRRVQRTTNQQRNLLATKLVRLLLTTMTVRIHSSLVVVAIAALRYHDSAIELVDGKSNSNSGLFYRSKPNHPSYDRPLHYHNCNNNNNNNQHNACFVPSAAPTNQESHPTGSDLDDSLEFVNKRSDGPYYKSGNIIGLQNLGHTCYLNAQIQCVYHIPLIRNMIISKYEVSSTIPREKPSSSSTSPAHVGLRQLFIDMNESEYGRAVTTKTLCELIDIPTYEQQDTQEFWKLLLPALQLPTIMDLYTGTYENYIKALDGSHRERRFLETFLDISLDINPSTATSIDSEMNDSISVMDALQEQFNQPELLSVATGNGWRPSSESPDKVDAHKGYQLQRRGLPTILQLHLKRFHFDWNTETTNKLNHAVKFPLTLDLSSLVPTPDSDDIDIDNRNDDDCIYELQSVIIHVGEYHSGHYYSYVRPNIRTDDWYRFNDEIHTKVRFTDVIQDAYGGIVSTAASLDSQQLPKMGTCNNKGNRIVRFFRGIFGMDGADVNGYGFGGPKSNAYVLQYIRRSDIPKLYDVVSD